jgi:hypothetical protein
MDAKKWGLDHVSSAKSAILIFTRSVQCLNPPVSTPFSVSACDYRFYENAPRPKLKDRTCDACGKDVQGFVYQCVHKDRDLHPCCMKLQGTLIGNGMTLHLRNSVATKCLKCGCKEVSINVKGCMVL